MGEEECVSTLCEDWGEGVQERKWEIKREGEMRERHRRGGEERRGEGLS